MKKYLVKLNIGTHVLSATYESIVDVFLCLNDINNAVERSVPVDLEGAMFALVRMCNGSQTGHTAGNYTVTAIDAEE